jgi:SNF2 family DNA or RNA helicase
MMMISKSVVKAFLNAKRNSYLWMKALKRDQLMREIRAFVPRPIFQTPPWTHQAVGFMIGMVEKRFIYHYDMGTGKTWILINLFNQFKREGKVRQGLIIAPRLVVLDSWRQAVEEHSQLDILCIDVKVIQSKWERLINSEADLTVIDYHGMQLALSREAKTTKGKRKLVKDDLKIKALLDKFQFLGIDEIHYAKHHDTLRFSILRQLAKMEYCYGISGTLWGKDPTPLWAEFFLIDGGETMGETLGLFREAFFTKKPGYWQAMTYTFDENKIEDLNRFLNHRSLRYEDTECGDLPKMNERPIVVGWAPEQREHYINAVQGMISAGGDLRELDAAWLRMRQIIAGFLGWKDEYGKHLLRFDAIPKLDALATIVESIIDNHKIIINHEYHESGKIIADWLKESKIKFAWLYGGTKDKPGALRKFLEDDDCRVFLMNSISGGTGTDGLQKVCHHMAIYESPCDPITRKQLVKRVHRPGQAHPSFIYDIQTKASVDIQILRSIQEGNDLYKKIIGNRRLIQGLLQLE